MVPRKKHYALILQDFPDHVILDHVTYDKARRARSRDGTLRSKTHQRKSSKGYRVKLKIDANQEEGAKIGEAETLEPHGLKPPQFGPTTIWTHHNLAPQTVVAKTSPCILNKTI
ncbi:hypothetical protein JCM33374_g3036 [Metschnikowia sp. JCM 33374]|nr:hypothetical protein JCM33374_g3036 [Metschnikowia sp. JCM 33374]